MPGNNLNSKDNSNKNSVKNKKKDPCAENIKNLAEADKKIIGGLMKAFGKIMILWLISKKRQHGYEIMTQIHKSSPYNKKMPSASMIYPVLHDLEKKGMICGAWEKQGKRRVKYYAITADGEKNLENIRKIAQCNREHDNINIWDEFMDDLFGYKTR
ncbi:MAG TPA: PadR family transcriptional regulator [Methanobacteriaceae archaeon]|nr:PadR family transcriptional regulator [Methanobacteriaceae archaeon]